MTDPLGQSQVIPYLMGLSELGYIVHILSTEKPENYHKNKLKIAQLLAAKKIKWHPVFYTKKPPVLSTIFDIYKIISIAKKLHKENNFHIVHCRSYISAFAGLFLKKKYGVKFIFDMRGFYADERVDGKIWNLKNPVFYFVYHYFKKKEITFLKQADHVVSLTKAGKKIIEQWGKEKNFSTPVTVIPCCADLDFFSPVTINPEKQKQYKDELKIQNHDFIISYLGSVGTWYMLEEMLDFFKVCLHIKPEAKFLFITKDNPVEIIKAANRKNIPETNILIRSAEREEMPSLLGLSNFSLFFIKPVFSKKASSPTKMGEILGLGIPVVCNSGVGDVDEIITESKSGILVQDFNENSYKNTLLQLENNKFASNQLIKAAHKYYSLKEGITRYSTIYSILLK